MATKKSVRITITAKSSVYSFRKLAPDYTILRLLLVKLGKVEGRTISAPELIKKYGSAYGAAKRILKNLQGNLKQAGTKVVQTTAQAS